MGNILGRNTIGKLIIDWLEANKGVTVKFTSSLVRFIRPDITGLAEGKGPARGRETAVSEKRNDEKRRFITVHTMMPIAPGE